MPGLARERQPSVDWDIYLVSEVGMTVHMLCVLWAHTTRIVQTVDTRNACTARPSAFEQPDVVPEHVAVP